MKNNGFSLIELLVVVTVIGILTSLGISSFKGAQAKARDSIRQTDLKNLATALEVYYQKNGSYIDGTAGVDGDCSSADTAKFYSDIAPYMVNNSVPKDPQTGNFYCYVSIGNIASSYRLFARLEDCSSLNNIPGTNCQTAAYNFSVASPDLGIASAPTPAPTPAPFPSTGLVSYWKMDETSGITVADSLNAHNGSGNAAVTAGKIGNARSFNGSSNYISLANPTTNFPSGAAAKTLCFWGYNTSSALPRSGVFLGTASNGQAFFVNAYNGTNMFAGGYGSDTTTITGFWPAASWKHVCLTYAGTTAIVYGNGTQVSADARIWNLVLNQAFIGRGGGAFGYWQGYIDEVGLWNRALTAIEISTLYNGGVGLTYP